MPGLKVSGGLALRAGVRIAVIASAIAAVGCAAWFESRAWSFLPAAVAVLFLASALFARRIGHREEALLLGLTFILPSLLYGFGYVSLNPWLPTVAIFLGLSVAAPAAESALPSLWRAPLAYWALAVALTWPIVALRELDFDFALWSAYALPITSRGISPPEHVSWIASVAAAQLAALLWLDRLFRAFRDRPIADFERRVAWPLLASVSLAALAAVYQWVIDIRFLNPMGFAAQGRSTGTMFDANALGAAAGIWIAGAVALLAGSRTLVGAALAIGAVIVLGLGTLATSSRTGLLLACAGAAAAAYLVWQLPGRARVLRRASLVAIVVTLVAAGVAVPAVRDALMAHRGAGRVLRALSAFGADDGGGHDLRLTDLIERDGYGTIADAMIGDHPIVGVGVGSYHALVLDYGRAIGERVPPDNAQNWFRHQLAELGLFGSLGWLVFLPMVWVSVVAGFRQSGLGARVLTFPLVAMAVISLVSMPTQNPAVLLSLCTLVFWQTRAAERPQAVMPRRAAAVAGWTAALLAVVFAASTYAVARSSLRVPSRAAGFNWPFERGFYPASGAGDRRHRWSARRGTITFAVEGPYLRLAYWVRHRDLAERPAHVRIWIDGEKIVEEDVGDFRARVVYVRMAGRRGVLDVDVDRVVTAGTPDAPGRELGVAFADWQFTVAPPPGARVVGIPNRETSR